MRVFQACGTVCAHCGEKGTHFAVERPEFSEDIRQWHFNLYSENNVMLTFDHVMPKSKGGANTIENAQTLCYPCNQTKADNV
jgi:5-methylcytosine-specific restriction endonuclease McrA